MLLLYLALDLLVLLNDELKVSSRALISTRAEHLLTLSRSTSAAKRRTQSQFACFNIYESRTPANACRSTSAAWRRIQSQSALLQYRREPN